MKNKNTLKDELYMFPNNDKTFQDSWDNLVDEDEDGKKIRKKLNFPTSFRMCIIMPTGKGKTNIVKNILAHQNPNFDRMYVLHGDSETREYEDCNAIMMGKVPDEKFFNHPANKGKKILFVADDFKFEKNITDSCRRLCRIFTYISSHCNVSCIVCLQDGFANFPSKIRRNCNIFITCRQTDLKYQNSLASVFGMEKDKFNGLLKQLDYEYDTIWIDRTKQTKYPIRKNGSEIIQ